MLFNPKSTTMRGRNNNPTSDSTLKCTYYVLCPLLSRAEIWRKVGAGILQPTRPPIYLRRARGRHGMKRRREQLSVCPSASHGKPVHDKRKRKERRESRQQQISGRKDGDLIQSVAGSRKERERREV